MPWRARSLGSGGHGVVSLRSVAVRGRSTGIRGCGDGSGGGVGGQSLSVMSCPPPLLTRGVEQQRHGGEVLDAQPDRDEDRDLLVVGAAAGATAQDVTELVSGSCPSMLPSSRAAAGPGFCGGDRRRVHDEAGCGEDVGGELAVFGPRWRTDGVDVQARVQIGGVDERVDAGGEGAQDVGLLTTSRGCASEAGLEPHLAGLDAGAGSRVPGVRFHTTSSVRSRTSATASRCAAACRPAPRMPSVWASGRDSARVATRGGRRGAQQRDSGPVDERGAVAGVEVDRDDGGALPRRRRVGGLVDQDLAHGELVVGRDREHGEQRRCARPGTAAVERSGCTTPSVASPMWADSTASMRCL